LFALGTNIGIKRIVNSGARGVTEAQLRGTRRTYVTRDGLRRAIAAVVGETMRGRDPSSSPSGLDDAGEHAELDG
jgi:hypothetical protein